MKAEDSPLLTEGQQERVKQLKREQDPTIRHGCDHVCDEVEDLLVILDGVCDEIQDASLLSAVKLRRQLSETETRADAAEKESQEMAEHLRSRNAADSQVILELHDQLKAAEKRIEGLEQDLHDKVAAREERSR